MIEFDIKKVKNVAISKVKRNSWNPKHENTAEYPKIKASIERDGQKVPSVVREKHGALEIIDGQQRWTAMRELGMKQICVNNRGKVSDEDAMNGTLWYQVQAPMIEKEAAKLTKELKDQGLETAFDFSAIQEFDSISFDEPKLGSTMERSKYEIITETLQAIVEEHGLNDFSEALQVICASYQGANR